MNILFVDWVSIPKEIHLDILKAISVGEYIASLPYNTSDSLSWKIPTPAPIVVAKADPRIIIDTEYMEFRKHQVFQRGSKYPHPIVKRMYAWERAI